MLRALPLPCFFSIRAKYLLPAAFQRRNSAAASEKAHLRWTLADLGPSGLLHLARGLMPAFDQTGVGEKVLDAGEPLEVVDLVEQSQGQNLADSRDGAQEVEGPFMIISHLVEEKELQLTDDLVVGVEQGDVGGHCHLDAGLLEVLDDGAAVLGLVDPLFEGREVVLSVGVLDV